MHQLRALSMLALSCILLLSFSVFAQNDESYVITVGLNNPRAIFYGTDGEIYVVDSGVGGMIETATPIELAAGGGSSNVYLIEPDGTQHILIYGLLSVIIRGTEAAGASDIVVTDDAVWLLLSQGSALQQNNPTNPFSYALVKLNRETLRVEEFIDFYAYELENNPDGNELDSNPQDIAIAADGTIYIADAGANTVYSWTEATGLQVFHAWGENPVPTSVAIGPDGNLYVGFLTAFPFPTEGARIEKWSTDGELLETFSDLTMVVDVVVAEDGTIYATELGQFDLEAEGSPWLPESGKVVEVTADGPVVVSEGLNFPYGLAINPSGGLTITVNSAFTEPGAGAVINVGG
jgi:sugar lactone lactonase YvrE